MFESDEFPDDTFRSEGSVGLLHYSFLRHEERRESSTATARPTAPVSPGAYEGSRQSRTVAKLSIIGER